MTISLAAGAAGPLGGEGLNAEVLIVDDSRHVRHLLRDALATIGVRLVHEAEEGSEACKLLAGTIKPDLVITDLMMSPMNGLDLLRMIRSGKAEVHPFIPVIVVSGFSDVDNVSQASASGANGFIKKPFTPKDLGEKVAAAVLRPPMFVRTATYFGPDRRVQPRPRTTSGDDCEFFVPCPRRYGEYVRAYPGSPKSCGRCPLRQQRCEWFLSVIERSGYEPYALAG